MIEVKDAVVCTDKEGGDVEHDFSQMMIFVGQSTYVIDLPPSMKRKEARKFAEDYTAQIRGMIMHVEATVRDDARRKMRKALGL